MSTVAIGARVVASVVVERDPAGDASEARFVDSIAAAVERALGVGTEPRPAPGQSGLHPAVQEARGDDPTVPLGDLRLLVRRRGARPSGGGAVSKARIVSVQSADDPALAAAAAAGLVRITRATLPAPSGTWCSADALVPPSRPALAETTAIPLATPRASPLPAVSATPLAAPPAIPLSSVSAAPLAAPLSSVSATPMATPLAAPPSPSQPSSPSTRVERTVRVATTVPVDDLAATPRALGAEPPPPRETEPTPIVAHAPPAPAPTDTAITMPAPPPSAPAGLESVIPMLRAPTVPAAHDAPSEVTAPERGASPRPVMRASGHERAIDDEPDAARALPGSTTPTRGARDPGARPRRERASGPVHGGHSVPTFGPSIERFALGLDPSGRDPVSPTADLASESAPATLPPDPAEPQVRYTDVDASHARVEVTHPVLGVVDVVVHHEGGMLDVALLTRSIAASIALRAAEESLRHDLRGGATDLRSYRVRTERRDTPHDAEATESDGEELS